MLTSERSLPLLTRPTSLSPEAQRLSFRSHFPSLSPTNADPSEEDCPAAFEMAPTELEMNQYNDL
jgi:hypothetical protein